MATCRMCEEVEVPTRASFCSSCIKKRKRMDYKVRNRRLNNQGLGSDEGSDHPIYQPWKPRPKPAPIMTNAEQERIDADCHRRDIIRMGIQFDRGRKLSRKEIAAIAHTITPIGEIKDKGLRIEEFTFIENGRPVKNCPINTLHGF